MRCVWAVVLAVALGGCGRFGYVGAPSSDQLAITADASTINLRGLEYELVFDAAHMWQPISWVDLASDPDTELAGGAGAALGEQVLQSPFAVQYGGVWYELDAAGWSERAIYELDSERILLEVVYGWEATDGTEIDAFATHEIFRDGTWNVTAALENKSDDAKQFNIAYAVTHVQPSLGWTETTGAELALEAQTGARFAFGPMSGQPGTLESNGAGSFRFAAGLVDLGSYELFEASWTNRLTP
jgi:hypothetical protein